MTWDFEGDLVISRPKYGEAGEVAAVSEIFQMEGGEYAVPAKFVINILKFDLRKQYN